MASTDCNGKVPIDIIFSHKARMTCIVEELKNRYPDQNRDVKAKEPRNGGIIIIFEPSKAQKTPK